MVSSVETQAQTLRRGPRPGSSSLLQRSQRATTRSRILQATYELLSERSFNDLAIDDVISAASVGRGTFYRHFKSKFELVFALYDLAFPHSLARFEKLAILGKDRHKVVEWVQDHVAAYRVGAYLGHVFLELGVTHKEFHERLRLDRQKVIDHLAGRLPAFASTQGDTPEALQQRVRADLLIMQINRLCCEIVLHGNFPNEQLYVNQIAHDVLSFLEDY